MMSLSPYHYVRWTWSETYEVAELSEKLRRFTVTLLRTSAKEGDTIMLSRRDIDILQVKADTLSARLAPSRAVLYQKESAPFTKRDIELRRVLLQLYNRSRPTPLPMFFQREPRFDTQTTS